MGILQTTDIDQPTWRAPETQPTLRLLYAGGVGAVEEPGLVLHQGVTQLGREAASPDGVSLPQDRCASRVHATIELPASGSPPRLVDGGSRNGTFVNGRRVSECLLSDNDVIRIGNSLLLLRMVPAAQGDAEVPGLLGCSPAVRTLRQAVAKAARSSATCLLLGESGTGKEVVAQALHKLSERKGPLIAVNCAAISESLAESQLFGHVPGAFTGARTAQDGYFRSAHGGTLFLDELGEMPMPLQAKLLRVLEERQVTPVGSTRPLPVDACLIAATNRDLLSGIRSGSFRGDLYARLAQVLIRLPPLSSRREDILPLLLHFLGAPVPRLSPGLAEALVLHPFPFNVRELGQLAAILRGHREDELDVPLVSEHLAQHARVVSPLPPTPGAPDRGPHDEALARQGARPAEPSDRRPVPTREALVQALREHRGNISQVARLFGRSRRQVDRWLEQHGLDRSEFLR
jgi:DNA-binding NtrC family response regulator